MPRDALDFDALCSVAMKLPGVEAGTIRGAPSLKARGKLLCCPALHKSAEPNSVVVRIGTEERAQLISARPDAYYLTEHYASYPMVLVRLSQLDRKSVLELLEKSWQFANTNTDKAPRTASGLNAKRVAPVRKKPKP